MDGEVNQGGGWALYTFNRGLSVWLVVLLPPQPPSWDDHNALHTPSVHPPHISSDLTCNRPLPQRVSSWQCLSSCHKTACTSSHSSRWPRHRSLCDPPTSRPAWQSPHRHLTAAQHSQSDSTRSPSVPRNNQPGSVFLSAGLQTSVVIGQRVKTIHQSQRGWLDSPKALETSPGQVHPPS